MPTSKAFDLTEAARKLSENLRRSAMRPSIHAYRPHVKQEPFHMSPEKGRLYIGGNRSGKTTAGICEDIWWLTGRHPYRVTPDPPVRGRIVGVDFLNGIEKILLPEMARWLPLSDIKGGSWDKAYSKQLRTLTFENGSFVEFMCVDSTTEILTKRGWLTYKDLVIGEDVLTYNQQLDKTEWKSLLNLTINEYDGELVGMTPYSEQGNKMTISSAVTYNHKWMTTRGLVRTDGLNITDKIILVADCLDDPESVYTDEFVALSGWIAGDGSIKKDGAVIYQSHVNYDKQLEIEKWVEESGFRYRVWSNEIYTVWKLYGKFEKYLDVTKLSSSQRQLYLECLLKADGIMETTGKWQFTNTDMQLIDLVMMLGTLCGYRISMSERSKSEWGRKNVYCVMGRAKTGKGRSSRYLTVENSKRFIQYYKGIVWCPTTENQTFVARRNGTVYITGNSYDQDLDKFAGTSRHFTHFDEEPPQDIYNECRARLVDTGGHWWTTMTPLDGLSWTYDEIYLPGKNNPEANIKVVEVDMQDNPYLNPGEVEAFLMSLDRDEREARGRGKFIQIGGLVYKTFDPDIIVIDPVIPPKNWEWYASMDHGFNAPTCWLWHAVSPDGEVITFAEHYEAERTVDYHASVVHARNSGFGRIPDIYVGDPAIAQRQGVTGVSIQTVYADLGISIIPGNNDVVVGVDRVNQYIKKNRWKITRNCPNLIKEMQRLRWRTYETKKKQNEYNKMDQIHKKDDHAPDSCRYFFTMMPDLGPVELPKVNPEVFQENLLGATSPVGFSRIDEALARVTAPPSDNEETKWFKEYMDDYMGGIY